MIAKFRLATIIFLLLNYCSVHAQTFNLQGTITTHDGVPCSYAEVYLLQDSITVMASLSDSLGNYNFDSVKVGHYKINAIWNDVYQNSISLSDSGMSQLKRDFQLDSNFISGVKAVTITGRKQLIEKRVDRTIVNVENSVFLTGASALDAIKKAPGVVATDQEIKIIGKSTLNVMINDRLVQMSGADLINYLKSLPADALQKIEIITTPPAKYDASGNSGIINLVLKKGKSNSWNNQITSSTTYAKYWEQRFSDVFNYNHNGLRIFANGSIYDGIDYNIESNKTFYPNDNWSAPNKTKSDGKSGYGSGNIDYDISKKTTIGVQFSAYKSKNKSTDSTLTTRTNDEAQMLQYMWSQGYTTLPRNSQAYNAHLTHTFDSSGKKLAIDADYYRYRSQNRRDFSTSTYSVDHDLTNYLNYNNQNKQNFYNYSVKADMEHPTKFATLTYGAKYSSSQTDNNVTFYDNSSGVPIYDPNRSDHFIYDEKIAAVYGDISKKFGNKWETKLGLRSEYTFTKGTSQSLGDNIERKYLKFFPTAYILYKMNESNSFNLNYSRRIQRPDFWSLNPFRWYINQYNFAEGNPYLQPSYTNNFELSHTFKNVFTSTFSYTYGQNLFTQYPTINATTKVLIYKRDNLIDYHSFVLTESFNSTLFTWWETNNQMSIYYNKFINLKADLIDIALQNGLGLYFSSNQSFTLNTQKTLFASVDYWATPFAKDGVFTNKFTGSLDIGAKALFFDKKLTIGVNTWDLFRTNRSKAYGYNNGIKTSINNFYNSRCINMVLKYTFGNAKIGGTQHNSGNDISNRVK